MSAIIVTNSVSLDKTADYLTKDSTETFSNLGEKKSKGGIYKEATKVEDKVIQK